MPLDLSGFKSEPNQWAGLYHAADQLEKRKLRQDQLDLQKQSRRAAAGTFLQNYLDPKDMLTGTAYDPMIVQGLQAAQQQGAALAAAGADAPTLMMALGPMVNKLTQYSTNAKTINKQVDDQIKLMRESGLTGYDYGKLKDLAMKKAFYKQGANGQELNDPSEVDPSANYIQKAIQEHPEQVTTAAGLDLFAKNSPMQKMLDKQVNYDKFGNMSESKVHLIGQNWLTPEYDPKDKGHITDLVPKHDIATEQGQPLFHEYKNELGKSVSEPVRLLSEDVFDDMMQRRPDIANYMRGIVNQHIKEYKDPSGNAISIDDPKAKMIARAIAYKELYNRRNKSIEDAEINDKPSPAQVNLNIKSTDKYLQNVEDLAAAAKRGRSSVLTPAEQAKLDKRNVGQVFGSIFNGKEDLSQNEKMNLNATVHLPDGSTTTSKDRQVVDILSKIPGGVLKAGRGVDYKYKGIYFDPSSRSLVVAKEEPKKSGGKHTSYDEIPEANVGQFINKIAEANGIPSASVKKLLESMNYRNGKFGGNANAPAVQNIPKPASPASVNPTSTAPAIDYKKELAKRRSWRDSVQATIKNKIKNQ